MKKVVVFLADGFEEVEGLTVHGGSFEKKQEQVVETVSVMGKQCRLTELHGIQVEGMNCLKSIF